MKKIIFPILLLTILFSCNKSEDPKPEVVELDRPIEVIASKGEYGNKIIVSWEAMPNVMKYHIYKFSEVENDYTFIQEVTDNSFTDTSSLLLPYIKEYYKVKSYNSESSYSGFSDVDFGYISGKTYDLVLQFGSEGTSNGQFQFPQHLAIDFEDNIYVSDPNSNKIQKFSNSGNFIDIFFSTQSPRGLIFIDDGNSIVARSEANKISVLNGSQEIIREWGGFGTGDGQFHYFRQICIDDEQNIYVVDHSNDRIQKFDLYGNFLLKWGTSSEQPGNGTFKYPWGISLYKNNVLVSSQNIVQFFNKNGEFIKQLDLGYKCYDITNDGTHFYVACGSCIIKTDETGDVLEKIGQGDFFTTTSVVIDSNGNVVAVDVSKRKVSVFEKN